MKKIAWVVILLHSLAWGPCPRAYSEPGMPEQNQNLTLNFQNTDIDLVLKFLSDALGKTFIKSDQVRGFVTVVAPGQVTRAEALQIFQTVLEVKGFTLIPGAGNIVKVLTQGEAAQTDLEVGVGNEEISRGEADRMISQVIPLKFLAPQEIKAEISPLLSKAGTIITDDRMNSLVITDMASNIRRLMKIIASLDIRSPQVLIEALIMEVTLTKETKLGIEWSHSSGFSSGDHHFVGALEQNFNLSSLITEGLQYSIIRDDLNLKALLSMLATDQNVNILSTPHILTLNNQPAVIRVGEEVPVLTQTRNIQGGETIRSYDYKSVAMKLEVTPRINHDREVYLKVHPLIKKILGFNAELNAPILAAREAQTTVSIMDGQTVVIGGLMKDDQSVSQSKVPFLGDIPILGYLFKKSATTREKTELLVFITPRVVTNTAEARELTIKKESETKEQRTPFRLDAAGHYRQGKFLLKEKRYEEAIQEFNAVLGSSPDEKLKRQAAKLIQKAKKAMPIPKGT